MQPRHHYEQAFEEYLRSRRIPYVAVHEARKALLPEVRPAPLPSGAPAAALKSFDFVLYADTGNLLVECKGRKIAPRRARTAPSAAPPSRPGPRAPRQGRLESWVTEDDVSSLTAWEALFGEGFTAAFVFIYWCEEQPSLPLFEEIFEYRARWYAIRAVHVRDYARLMRPRSPRWRTVHLPGADFDQASRALGARPSPHPLHAPAPEVVSPR